MHALVLLLIEIISLIIDLFKLAVWVSIIMSWLVMFDVVNTRNRAVYMIMDAANRITEPTLRRIRRYMPNTGALDLSAWVLLVILYLIQDRVLPIIAGAF